MEEILKILVVDDDEVDRLAVRRALKAAGVRTELHEAKDCAEAMATLKDQNFDCVLLDYHLPDGDGLAVVRALQKAGVKTPLVVLTGQGDEEIAVELMKAGASDYLSKAKVSPENLSKSLHSAIRLHRAEMQAAIANLARTESEERYRLVLEGANDGIWDWNISRNEIYCNDRFFEITGLDSGKSALTYEAFCDLAHPEDRQKFISAVTAHLEGGVEFNVELRLRHACGGYRYCVARARARRDASGEPFRMSGTVTDITERKQAEDALRFLAEASEVLSASLDYQTTLKNLANLTVPQLADWCAVDVAEGSGAIERVAVACADSLKVESESAGSANSADLQTGTVCKTAPAAGFKSDPKAAAGAPKVRSTGQSEFYPELPEELLASFAGSAEHRQILRELGPLSAICVPLQVRGRTLGTLTFVCAAQKRRYDSGSLALAEDLGRRAALAIDNARLYREAQEANRMKDEFLATLSHELRTPLNAMLGWAQLLKNRKLDEEKTVRALETIERNARSQTQMIEDLLDVSRIIRGQLNLNMRPVELVAVIEAALETVRPAAAARGIELLSIFEPTSGLVLGDVNRLQQVVWNLLSNAVKFTQPGGRVEVRLSVGVGDGAWGMGHGASGTGCGEKESSAPNSQSSMPSAPCPTPYAQFRVSDTGIGISRDFLPFVFERFRQADATTTRSYSGLGLGLAIVRHLVELHGGSVGAYSAGPDLGATFTVRLPLLEGSEKPQPSERDGKSRPQPTGSRPAHPLTGLRVLVVDDEPDTRDLISVVLKQYGASVRAAASAGEALNALEMLNPDVLVSDIGMPGEDGYALIRRVRAMEAQLGGFLPAVALTAYARESDRRQAIDAGFQMHVPKPVEPAELVATVALLAGRTAQV
ncbi:MAG: response regulator [Oscillatoria princeps RMCB-10]|jgi:PAS domain S-box-containing protein|nr:response regulator [Oscillatoria princeps RMCB-10]